MFYIVHIVFTYLYPIYDCYINVTSLESYCYLSFLRMSWPWVFGSAARLRQVQIRLDWKNRGLAVLSMEKRPEEQIIRCGWMRVFLGVGGCSEREIWDIIHSKSAGWFGRGNGLVYRRVNVFLPDAPPTIDFQGHVNFQWNVNVIRFLFSWLTCSEDPFSPSYVTFFCWDLTPKKSGVSSYGNMKGPPVLTASKQVFLTTHDICSNLGVFCPLYPSSSHFMVWWGLKCTVPVRPNSKGTWKKWPFSPQRDKIHLENHWFSGTTVSSIPTH